MHLVVVVKCAILEFVIIIIILVIPDVGLGTFVVNYQRKCHKNIQNSVQWCQGEI